MKTTISLKSEFVFFVQSKYQQYFFAVAVGVSLARVLEYSAAKVYKEFYVNDAGVQISHLKASVEAVREGRPVPEDGYHGAYIKELAEEVSKTGEEPQILMQKHQQETLAKFRSRFDNWFSEKSHHVFSSTLISSIHSALHHGFSVSTDCACD